MNILIAEEEKDIGNFLELNLKQDGYTVELDDEVQIIFKDDGIGIPSELADKIFNPFVRVDSSRSSDTGGTGLGFAIVAKIIQAHGGTIALRTERDSGCEFLISLPKYNKSI